MFKKVLIFTIVIISFGCESDFSQPPENVGHHLQYEQDDNLSADELKYIIEGSRQGYRD